MGGSRWLGCSVALMVLLGGTIAPVVQPAIAAEQKADDIDRAFSEGLRLFQEGSKESLERAASQFEKLLSQRSLDRDKQALSLLYLGRIHADLGKYQEALSFYNQALSSLHGVDDQRTIAVILNNISRIYIAWGEQQKALKFLDQSLALSRTLRDKAGEATTLNNMGLAHFEFGDKRKALDIYNQALPLLRITGDKRGEALALNNIGLTYHSLGEKQKSLDFFDQALLLHRAVKNRNGEATTLNNIGMAYFGFREMQKALNFYEQALLLSRVTGDRYKEASILSNIGLVHNLLAQNQTALEFYGQSLSLRRAIGDREGEAMTINNIGGIFHSLKDYQQALRFFSQSLKLFENLDDRNGIATASNNLGDTYNNLKIKQKSLGFYHRALSLRRAINDREGEASTLYNIGVFLQEQNQPKNAIAFYKQSVNVYEFLRSRINTLPRSTQGSYTQSISDAYRRLSDLLIQQNRLSEAQQVLELLKLREIKELNPNQLVSDAPVRQMPISDVEKQAIAQISPEAAKDITSTNLPQPDRLSPTNSLNQSAQALLTAQPNAALIYQLFTQDKLWLILITPDGKLQRFASTANQTKIESLAKQFRNQVEQCEEINYTCDKTDTQALNQTSQQLHQQLFPPDLQTALKAAKTQHLILALDGSLRNIPMAALHNGQQYLVEQYTLSSIIAAQLTDSQDKLPTNPSVLAVGTSKKATVTVPDYVDADRQDEYSGLGNVPIELNAVTSSNSKSPGLFPGRQLLDEQFTLPNLRQQLPQHRLFHIGSHGIFRPNFLDYSYILMGNNQPWSIAQMDTEGNGKLFQNIHMVTLSACQSGLGGRDKTGIEIAGMSHAFLSQGAKTVTASLWKVNDESTAILMQRFYQNLARNPNQSKAESLHQAQLHLLKTPRQILIDELRGSADFRPIASPRSPTQPQPVTKTADYTHPYYWAAFTLIGNSR